MNSSSYSSRGMASAGSLPRIRKHETDGSHPGNADSGRHESSRDHYVKRIPIDVANLEANPAQSQSSRDDRRDRHRDRDPYRSERRRSRSPHRSSRSSRRDMEVDSYSSSRDYRAREREDRYSGREGGREDRAWDRDRGDRYDRGDRGMPRRDARREGDDRGPRRDRDLFDGRGDRGRGGGRPARSDRDEFAMQMAGRDRKKSASPPPKKKEPTPDLTDTIPITERKRRLTQWDIKPPGYENVTAEQAKLSGKSAKSLYSIMSLTFRRHVPLAWSASATADGPKSPASLYEPAKWICW